MAGRIATNSFAAYASDMGPRSSTIRGIIGAMLAGVAAPACGGGSTEKVCTEVSCADSFTATAQRADGSIPDGAHRIEILADGTTLRCAFTLPLAMGPGGGTAQPT